MGLFSLLIVWIEVKGKGEKERYTHLNAEFQRIARRDNKAFLSEQCKEVEENIRMGKADGPSFQTEMAAGKCGTAGRELGENVLHKYMYI